MTPVIFANCYTSGPCELPCLSPRVRGRGRLRGRRRPHMDEQSQQYARMPNNWEQTFAQHLRPLLPLIVRRAEWQEPSLTLGDDDLWGMAIHAAWRVTEPTGVAFGSSARDAADKVWDLCGLEVREVLVDRLVDPSLILSTGWLLDVFSDDWHDPWVIRLPDITLVGDASASVPPSSTRPAAYAGAGSLRV